MKPEIEKQRKNQKERRITSIHNPQRKLITELKRDGIMTSPLSELQREVKLKTGKFENYKIG